MATFVTAEEGYKQSEADTMDCDDHNAGRSRVADQRFGGKSGRNTVWPQPVASSAGHVRYSGLRVRPPGFSNGDCGLERDWKVSVCCW